jgi:hypothetical protein
MILATLILAAQIDACHVLTKKDVAAVQGAAFTQTKLTTRDNTTTCFYQLPTFSNSISLDLMRSGARAFWKENFEKEPDLKKPRKKKLEPLKVTGIGNQALWVGGVGTGSLYVRKGDALVRVSVGGPGDRNVKIERSKKLALEVLKKL